MDPLYLPDEEVFIKKCKDYVQKIENYQGTDPLHYWYSYLLWYENNFALNCQEHGLFFEILSQCLVCFELKNQYNDDRRFIKICTKFISYQDSDHEDTYEKMYENDVGKLVADLYVCWAQFYNIENRFEDVEKILNIGLTLKASPRPLLVAALHEFNSSKNQRIRFKENEQFCQRNGFLMRKHLSKITSIRATQFSSKSSKLTEFAYNKNKHRFCIPFYGQPDLSLKAIYPQNGLRLSPIIMTSSEEMYTKGIQLLANFARKNLPQKIKTFPQFFDAHVDGPRKLLPGYNIFKLFPYAENTISPEEIMANKWRKSNNIVNPYALSLTINQVLQDGFNAPIRWPPTMARKNLPQPEWNVPRIDEERICYDGTDKYPFGFKFECHYPANSNEELSIEELMSQRRKRAKEKEHINQSTAKSDLDDVNANRTLRPSLNISKHESNLEKTQIPLLFRSISKAAATNGEIPIADSASDLKIVNESELAPANQPEPSMENTFKRKLPNDSFNDTCSTQMFDLLLKRNAISTPVVNKFSKTQYDRSRSSEHFLNNSDGQKENKFGSLNVIREGEVDETPPMAEIKENQKKSLNSINSIIEANNDSPKTPPNIHSIFSPIHSVDAKKTSKWFEFELDDSNVFLAEEAKSTMYATPLRKNPQNLRRSVLLTPSIVRKTPCSQKFSDAATRASTTNVSSIRLSLLMRDDEKDYVAAVKQSDYTLNMNGTNFALKPNIKHELKPTISAISEELNDDDDVEQDDHDDVGKSIYEKQPELEQPYQEEEEWLEVTQFLANEVARNEYHVDAVDLNKTEHTINTFMLKCRDMNPFDSELKKAFLESMGFIESLNGANNYNCHLVNVVQPLKPKSTFKFGNESFHIKKLIGTGAFGKVFMGECKRTKRMLAFKQERPPNIWEYYICLQVQERIDNKCIRDGFMSIDFAVVGNFATIFASKFSKYGTLINVCNKVKQSTGKVLDEAITIILVKQLLSLIDYLHRADIIHGDIKPDNILLMDTLSEDYNNGPVALQLIDFGRSIDLQQFPNNQVFYTKVKTENFICTQMMEDKPWKYEFDLFCLASTIYTLVSGKYMEVMRASPADPYKPKKLPRYVNNELWNKVFDALINANSPKLSDLEQILNEELIRIGNRKVITSISNFNKALH